MASKNSPEFSEFVAKFYLKNKFYYPYLFPDYMLNRKEVCHLLGLTANTRSLAGWNVTRHVTADLYNPSSQYSLELEVSKCIMYYNVQCISV